MSLEQAKPPFIRRAAERLKPLSRAIELVPTSIAVKLFLSRVESNIAAPIVPEFSQGFADAFATAIMDENVTPVLISSHESHADLIPAAIVTRYLAELANKIRGDQNPFPGFTLLIAASLESGNQGILLEQGTKRGKNFFLNIF